MLYLAQRQSLKYQKRMSKMTADRRKFIGADPLKSDLKKLKQIYAASAK